MAQELVARKCGILEEKQELDNMTLQKYLDLYKQPISEDSMEAIKKLAEVADINKKKKKGCKQGDKKDSKKQDKKKGKRGKVPAPALA